MDKKPLPRLLQSSVDPAKISLTIKGLAVFIPAIIFLAAKFGIDLTAESAGEIINQLAVAAGAAAAFWGLVRKLLVKSNPENETENKP